MCGFTYAPDANDTFVATFPKSGTHWMMHLALQLLHQGRAEFRNIYDVVPWYEMEIPGQASIWNKFGPRIVKSHMPWGQLPYSSEAKYIFVHRDPKEVFVSAWHFSRLQYPKAEISKLLDEFLYVGNFPGVVHWAEQTASYLLQRDKPNILNVLFSDMKADLISVVRVVANFLGIIHSEALISQVTCLASFAYMKANDWRFQVADRQDLGPTVRASSSDVHSVLTEDQCDEIESVCRLKLLDYGLDLKEVTPEGTYEQQKEDAK